MSFIGNLATAYSARAIGHYNAQLYAQQAAYARRQAEVDEAAYYQLDRPRLVKRQASEYSNFFVDTLYSGFEFSGSAYEVALDYRFNQATDMVIADYNQKIDNIDAINRSLLLEAKGIGEEFKGRLTARAEYIRTAGSLLSMAAGTGA